MELFDSGTIVGFGTTHVDFLQAAPAGPHILQSTFPGPAMHVQGNNSAANRSSADPTVTSTPAQTQGALTRITLGVQNFIDSLFPQNIVPAPAQPVQASSPQWQAKPTLPALASEQLRPALRQDNWEALRRARSDHPGLADDDRSLMWHAVQANAFHIAFELQTRGVDPFGPDAGTSPFYTVLQSRKYYVAEQMLARKVQKTSGELPDLALYLEDSLDRKDLAAIKWLINWCLKNNVSLPFDVLQDAIENGNRDRINLLAHGLKPLPGTVPSSVSAAWISTLSKKSGQTALHLAVESGDSGLVSTLLDCDPNVNRYNRANQTPLALALDKRLFDLAIELVKRGAQPIRFTSSSTAGEESSSQGHATFANEPVFVEKGSNAVSQSFVPTGHGHQIPALLPSMSARDFFSSVLKAGAVHLGLDNMIDLKKKEWAEFNKMAFKNEGRLRLLIQHPAHLQSFMEWMKVAIHPVRSLQIYNNICINDVRELAKILESNTTVTTIIFELTAIGSDGMRALAKMLENNTTITTIKLFYNNIGADGIQALAEMLKINSTITTLLFLENRFLTDDIQPLINVLEKNTSIKTIKLRHHAIDDNGARALAKMLKTNTTITTVDLKLCNIGDIGARALAEMLSINNTVEAIDLGCNEIGSNGIQALSEALKKIPL